MNLGTISFTIASHVTLIGILAVLAFRAMRYMESGMRASVSIACLSLGLERFYYVIALMSEPSALELWDAHPAPEVLSLLVGIGLYGVMVPMILNRCSQTILGWRKIARELALICVAWGALVMVLL